MRINSAYILLALVSAVFAAPAYVLVDKDSEAHAIKVIDTNLDSEPRSIHARVEDQGNPLVSPPGRLKKKPAQDNLNSNKPDKPAAEIAAETEKWKPSADNAQGNPPHQLKKKPAQDNLNSNKPDKSAEEIAAETKKWTTEANKPKSALKKSGDANENGEGKKVHFEAPGEAKPEK
ncbi:hypothetical protein BT96DRAFT_916967 [Gymnopus androsaceus JB14]|uniref:Uncharacterized protein n=1 Tax=Gymnopus androsaceus JB14 TaxID=1447944 RepID=A0A6A4I4Q5_9AGAR|nr:hypothetical protein BT96DRAFT_916967 [Gymnopus androsaceus JB14]